MRRTARTVAYTALLGFLGCTLGMTCLIATMCPMKSCEDCPVVVCHSTPAKSPEKVDAHQALPPSSLDLYRPASAYLGILPLAQIPTFLPHEFRRPMRN